MFDLVHKYKKLVMIILGLIAITFATWGLESYTSMRSARDTVASVNGMEISRREFSEQQRVQEDQLRRMFGGQIDPSVLDTPESRRMLLESLIARRLVASEAGRANMFMSREAVIDSITRAPEFQENGEFSPALYAGYLAQRGITDQGNVAELQSELPLARLAGAISGTAIAPRSTVQRLAAIEAQRREVSEARLALQQFLPQVKVGEADIKAHYEANLGDYRTPERVKAQYLVLSAEHLARDEPVSEAEIKAAYEARASQFRVEEQRRASHILLKSREEADKLAAELAKAPGRFAELAKRHSQDPGSAHNGGDLGWFGPGMMVKPFEEAAYQATQDEIRVVESEFGFHVLRVTGIQPGKARPYEEVKKELAEDLSRQKGARRFAEAAEHFRNVVYEQPDSLKPAAERFKLQIQSTGWIGKSSSRELGALDHPKLQQALFSPDAIEHKRNTDAIEVAPNVLVAARVVEHQPAAQRKYEEVGDQIAELLRRQEAYALAQKAGNEKLEQLRKGADAGLSWSQPRIVSRQEAQGLSSEQLRRVVSADVSKLPAYEGMPIPGSGYLLVRISKVIEAQSKAQQDAQNAARIANVLGGAQYQDYVASLRSRADIEINAASLEKR
jgi:peptidyl-prolyl cis-trans isomerase D